MQPTVSVIIPTYNRAHYLKDCINSVLAQTVPVDEILIVDDGSTDGTADLVSTWGDRITYVPQKNAGAAAARNLGMLKARGDFIAFQDSDDLWPPEKNGLQLEFFKRHPDVEIVFGLMANFQDSQEDMTAEIGNPAVYEALKASHSHVTEMFSLLLQHNMVPTPTVMFRRSCLEKAGLFDVKLRIAEDFEYWLRLASVCRFGFMDHVLLKRRRHDSNLINDRLTRLRCRIGVLENLGLRFPQLTDGQRSAVARQLSNLHYDLGSLCFRQGQFATALNHFRKCDQAKASRLALRVKLLIASGLAPLQNTRRS